MKRALLLLLLAPALAFGQTSPPEGGTPSAENLLTADTDTTKHLVPDGTGGVEWLVPAAAAPAAHAASHENGGSDEIDVTGLTGLPTAYDGGSVTNPFLAPDGTEALPGFAFTTDSSSGCRLAAAGDLYCGVGAENALRLREQDADTMIHDFLSGHYATNEIGVRFQLDSGTSTNTVSGFEPDAFGVGWQLSTTDTLHQFSLGAGVASDTYAVNLYGLGTGSFIQHKETGVAANYTRLAFTLPTSTHVVTFPALTGTVLLGGATNTPGATTLNASGDLVFTTDTAAHSLQLDSTGMDFVSDAGLNVDITDGTDILDMHFNVLGSPTINVQLDNGTESNEIAWSGVALTIDGDQDNNGTGNVIIGGGDIAITEDASGGDSTALVFAAPSGANTLTLPASTGTVAMLSDIGGGATRVSQAANLSTSALYSAAAATDLLFAPANSTEYHITGKVFVSSSATAHGLGYQFTWPTTDAIAGACSPLIQTSTTAHSYVTQEAASGATNGPISGASSPSPAGTVTVHTIDCYLSTTTNTSGNFAILFGGENGASTFVLYAGSYIDYEALP